MEAAVYKKHLSFRGRGLAVPIRLIRQWSRTYMKNHRPDVRWMASPRWTFRFRARYGLTIRVKTKMGRRLAEGVVIKAQERGWMDSKLVEEWVNQIFLPFIKPPAGRRRSKTLLVVEVANDVHTAPEVEEWVNPLFATAAEDAAAAEAMDHEDCGDVPPEEEEEEEDDEDEDEEEEEELDMEGDVEEEEEE
ncbi:unnamed protein product [Closterium sp. Naga37s-1]|nr:unnamed protein product [Closterium sp. Naga37s-1]